VLCTFGDGATSQGEWHVAVNFSAVPHLPVLWLCENNDWAISTPRSRKMKIEHVVDKADGYGIPRVRVDGFDPDRDVRRHESGARSRTLGRRPDARRGDLLSLHVPHDGRRRSHLNARARKSRRTPIAIRCRASSACCSTTAL